MADLSKFSIGGTAYNLKDTSARNSANAVTTAEEYDRQHIINAYGGRSLASVFASEIGSQSIYTWLRNRARNANFAGLRIGDYIDVPITAGANVPAQTVRYRIGAIDQYYQCGDTAKGRHIVMVPRAPVSVTGSKAVNTSYLQWRDTNDNNGTADEKHPYLCSKLHDWEINDFLPALPSALQSAIMTQRVLLEERYSSSGKLTEASSWSWVDLGKIWSPSDGGLRVPGLGQQGLLGRLRFAVPHLHRHGKPHRGSSRRLVAAVGHGRLFVRRVLRQQQRLCQQRCPDERLGAPPAVLPPRLIKSAVHGTGLAHALRMRLYFPARSAGEVF